MCTVAYYYTDVQNVWGNSPTEKCLPQGKVMHSAVCHCSRCHGDIIIIMCFCSVLMYIHVADTDRPKHPGEN
jgi:hypothetical protein